MIDVLSIFYNVEYGSKEKDCIAKLRTVTKEDRYFLRYEYCNDGLHVVELGDQKRNRILKTENDYKQELESLEEMIE